MTLALEIAELRARLKDHQATEGELLLTIHGAGGTPGRTLEDLPPLEVRRWLKILTDYDAMIHAQAGFPASPLNEFP